MRTIQVYDPPLYCSSGIHGAGVDPDIKNFDAMLSVLSGHGVRIVRYNFGLQPLAFAENATVKALLIQEGTNVLPVIFWDGEVNLKGRYPSEQERSAWFQDSLSQLESVRPYARMFYGARNRSA